MSEEKADYLDVDTSINGQQFVCLSFLSPESVMQNKEAFNCGKFLQSYCKDKGLNFDEVYKDYNDFKYKHEDKLQRDFDEQNKFQTSMRGIKVRGVYNTKDEAESRAKSLSLSDKAFHVFIGQVGYWLPWDPNADKVESEHFQNEKLNELMEKYQENNINRDVFYEEQKRDKMKAAQEERLKKEREVKEREDNSPEKIIEDVVEDVVEDVTVEDKNMDNIVNGLKEGSTVDSDIKESLESDDPWMQRKMAISGYSPEEDVVEEAPVEEAPVEAPIGDKVGAPVEEGVLGGLSGN